jgi:hypothetical protein
LRELAARASRRVASFAARNAGATLNRAAATARSTPAGTDRRSSRRLWNSAKTAKRSSSAPGSPRGGGPLAALRATLNGPIRTLALRSNGTHLEYQIVREQRTKMD